jgi:hypothetical protein
MTGAVEAIFGLGLLGCLSLMIFQALVIGRMRDQMEERGRIIEELKQDMAALLSCSRQLGDRLHKQERQIRVILQRQDQLARQETGAPPYRQATDMIRIGASTEAVISACGLSEGEAELIAYLNQFAVQDAEVVTET